MNRCPSCEFIGPHGNWREHHVEGDANCQVINAIHASNKKLLGELRDERENRRQVESQHVQHVEVVGAAYKRDTEALRAERDDLREELAHLREADARKEAEVERMRPVVEALDELEDAVEWLADDSARTEEWEQAWWDAKVAIRTYRAASSERMCEGTEVDGVPVPCDLHWGHENVCSEEDAPSEQEGSGR